MYHEDDQAAHVEDVPTPDKDGYWTRTPAGGLYYHANDPAREDDDQAAHVADEVRSDRHRAARIFRAFLAEVDATPFSVHEVYRDLCEAASIAIPLLESEARGE